MYGLGGRREDTAMSRIALPHTLLDLGRRLPTRWRTVAAVAVVGAVLVVGQAGFGQSSAPRTVKVTWGDTLWGLSRQYHVGLAQLAAANDMQVNDVLYAGRTLVLPTTNSGGESTGSGGRGAAHAAANPSVDPMTFCSTYQQPTEPRDQLPSELRSDPSRLALRPLFVQWADLYGVPADLIEGEAWQESGWQNNVVSPAGAVGIGQLLPATAAFVNQSLGTDLQLSVPSDNIRMMAAFLGYLLRATDGGVCGAVASYYEGFGTLQDHGVLPVSQVYVNDVLSLRPRFA